MSFGWSVGDIAQAIIIVTKTVKALNDVDGAPAHYREAVSFLTSLKRTLEPLATFEGAGLDAACVDEVKELVGKIKPTLETFLQLVRKYQENLGADAKPGRHRHVGSKLKWRFVESSAVESLRKGLESQMLVLNGLMQRLTLQMVLEIRGDMKGSFLKVASDTLGVHTIASSEDSAHLEWAKEVKSGLENGSKILREFRFLPPPQIGCENYGKVPIQHYSAIITKLEEQGLSLASILQTMQVQAASMAHDSKETAMIYRKEVAAGSAQSSQVCEPRPMFNIPQRAPHRFVGRKELLEKLASKLEHSGLQDRLALYGLSGIGKSCVTLEFAIRHNQKSPQTWILWLDGTTESTFLRDYREIAEHTKLLYSDESPESQISIIREWLDTKQSGDWLMVVDNVDDGALLDGNNPLIDMIPSNPNGSVVFTTRNKQIAVKLAPATSIFQIPALDVHEGLSFLGDFLGPDEAHQKNPFAAGKLLDLLEYQPLAIRCAGCFICSHSLSISSFLELYSEGEQEKIRLLSNEHITNGPTRPVSAILIFTMCFDQIKSKSPRAAEILSFMGCVSYRNVQRCLLPSGNDPKCATKIAIATALGILKAYSLITADSQDQHFCMHSLVQLSVRHWLRTNGEFQYWIREALSSLAGYFPSNPDIELGNLPLCDKYLPHVEAVLSNNGFSSGDNGLRCSLSHRLSRYFQIRGRADKAEEFAASAAELCSDDPIEISIKLEAYASVLRDNGKYSTALKLEQRVLKDRLEILRDNHEAILSSRNNIALSLQCPGEFSRAEEIHRFVLTQRILTLGRDHADTMSSLNNMSYVLQQQKKYSEAEQMAEEAVKSKRRVYGRNHFSTFQSMSSLAIVLQEQGKGDRAHAIHNQVLQGREHMLGKNHPLVLKTTTNMIGTLVQQGCLEEGERMARDVLERLAQVRGTHHPDVLLIKHNLAWILFQRNKNEESEDLARQTLKDRINVFGNSHPTTSSTQALLDELLQTEEDRMTTSTAPTTQ
ncbi:hypothetical protein BKA65DRAFT_78439 [Rhexocercosporidium sp. MPI-PUGE-AT-0058]|nr:hypothetical protein BKA65DRAFT_78439 [Rhexocercosporidium sp. MPI-PUGE-AT-0058]